MVSVKFDRHTNLFSVPNSYLPFTGIFEMLDSLGSTYQNFERLTFYPGETIVEAGSKFAGAFLVLNGQAKSYSLREKGSKSYVGHYSSSDVIGLTPFFAGAEKHNLAVIASCQITLLFIPTKKFQALIKNSPQMCQYLLHKFSRETNALTNKLKVSLNDN